MTGPVGGRGRTLTKEDVERFVSASNHYEALGLGWDAGRGEIKARLEEIQYAPVPARYHSQIEERARAIHQDLLGGKEGKEGDDPGVVERKRYVDRLRREAKQGLVSLLQGATMANNVLNDPVETAFYEQGRRKGFSKSELDAILAEYCAENGVSRGIPGAAAPAAPARSGAPATGSAGSARPPPPPPVFRRHGGTIEERVDWALVASSGAAGLSAICVMLLAGAGQPGAPGAFRMFIMIVLVSVGLRALHGREFGTSITTMAIAALVAGRNPLLLGTIIGVIGAGVTAAVTHRFRGSRVLAGTLATVVCVACLTAGAYPKASRPRPPSVPARTVGAERVTAPPGTVTTGPRASPGSTTPPVATAPAAVTVTLNSDPAGATAFIGGQKIGTTPCATTLIPGTYTATFTRRHYAEAKSRFTVAANTPATVAVTLEIASTAAGILGNWHGLFDGKEFALRIERYQWSGAISGSAEIVLRSGAKRFRFVGSYDSGLQRVSLRDPETGIEFSGTVAAPGMWTMSGIARTPDVATDREWSLSRVAQGTVVATEDGIEVGRAK